MSCSVGNTSTMVSVRYLFNKHTGAAHCVKETGVAQIYGGLRGVGWTLGQSLHARRSANEQQLCQEALQQSGFHVALHLLQ